MLDNCEYSSKFKTMSNFFLLPEDILNMIYTKYDARTRLLIKSLAFQFELRRMVQKKTHTDEYIKDFIKSTVPNIENQYGANFQILLYDKEEEHTKYKIIRGDEDPRTINLIPIDGNFDGFICSEKQMVQNGHLTCNDINLYNYTYDIDYLDLFMVVYKVEEEVGLYLYLNCSLGHQYWFIGNPLYNYNP